MTTITPSKLKVTELREELDKRGIKHTGLLKAALVEKLEEVLKKEKEEESQSTDPSSSSTQQRKDDDKEEQLKDKQMEPPKNGGQSGNDNIEVEGRSGNDQMEPLKNGGRSGNGSGRSVQEKEDKDVSMKESKQTIDKPLPVEGDKKRKSMGEDEENASRSGNDQMEPLKNGGRSGNSGQEQEEEEIKEKEEEVKQPKTKAKKLNEDDVDYTVDYSDSDNDMKMMMSSKKKEDSLKDTNSGSPSPSSPSTTTTANKKLNDNVTSSPSTTPTTTISITRKIPSTTSTTPQERPKVPPSTRKVTNTLFIDKFVRPLRDSACKEMLSETGNIVDFWMNDIKSYCYVTYTTEEEAVKTREAVYGLVWPPQNRSPLTADFVTQAEADRVKSGKVQPKEAHPATFQSSSPSTTSPTKSTTTSTTSGKSKSKSQKDNNNNNNNNNNNSSSSNNDKKDNNNKKDKGKVKEIDMTKYKVTTSSPQIHYRILTDDEVESRYKHGYAGVGKNFHLPLSEDLRFHANVERR